MAKPCNGVEIIKFLGRDPSSEDKPWSESLIQCYIVQEARRTGYVVTGSMEQGHRSKSAGGRAKAQGMQAGMPDMLYWLPNGVIRCIELKTTTGVLSNAQIEFHKILGNLGHSVNVVYAKTPSDGWNKVKRILECGIVSSEGATDELVQKITEC